MTVNMTKTQKIMDLRNTGDNTVSFMQDETYASVVIDRTDWEDMGSPKTLTVTIEPGDLLNPQPVEKPVDNDFIGIDPMDADTNGLGELEEVATEASDIEGGFDIEQCGIRQSHPMHTWSHPNTPQKPLMCEGL